MRVFAIKMSFRKSSFTEKLQRVLVLLRYQTKEEELVNETEKKNLEKNNSYYKFEATEATLSPVEAHFFLIFCILLGESFRRPISDIDFWKDDFVPHPLKKVTKWAELGFTGYAAKTVT